MSWNRPVCCVADFNAQEKVGGNTTLNHNNVKFREFIFNAGLIDLGFKGPHIRGPINRVLLMQFMQG
jgi:hypothetical protein